MVRKGISEEINLNWVWENKNKPAVQIPGEEGMAFSKTQRKECVWIFEEHKAGQCV